MAFPLRGPSLYYCIVSGCVRRMCSGVQSGLCYHCLFPHPVVPQVAFGFVVVGREELRCEMGRLERRGMWKGSP